MEIWKVAQFFITPARDGLHDMRNDIVLVGVDGAFIAVNPTLATHVVQHGTFLQSHGVWIHLDHLVTGSDPTYTCPIRLQSTFYYGTTYLTRWITQFPRYSQGIGIWSKVTRIRGEATIQCWLGERREYGTTSNDVSTSWKTLLPNVDTWLSLGTTNITLGMTRGCKLEII